MMNTVTLSAYVAARLARRKRTMDDGSVAVPGQKAGYIKDAFSSADLASFVSVD